MSTTTRYIHFADTARAALAERAAAPALAGMAAASGTPKAAVVALPQAQAAVMAKHKKTVGSGITKREVTRYSGEDMAAAFDAFARQWNAALSEGGGSFGARVLNAERACRSIFRRSPGRRPSARTAPRTMHAASCV